MFLGNKKSAGAAMKHMVLSRCSMYKSSYGQLCFSCTLISGICRLWPDSFYIGGPDLKIRPPHILSISDFNGNEFYNRIPLPIRNFYDRHRILPRTPRRWESIPDGLLLAVSIGPLPPRGSRRAVLRQKYHYRTCVAPPCRLQSGISKQFNRASISGIIAGRLYGWRFDTPAG